MVVSLSLRLVARSALETTFSRRRTGRSLLCLRYDGAGCRGSLLSLPHGQYPVSCTEAAPTGHGVDLPSIRFDICFDRPSRRAALGRSGVFNHTSARLRRLSPRRIIIGRPTRRSISCRLFSSACNAAESLFGAASVNFFPPYATD